MKLTPTNLITVFSIALLICGSIHATSDPPSVLVTEGVALHEAGDYEGAIATFKKALEEDPNDSVAIYELAHTYYAIGDYGQCLAFAEQGLKLKSDIEAMLFAVAGSCQSANGDTKKALKTFKRGLKRYPDDISLNINIAITLAKKGDLAKSKKHLKHVIALEPSHGPSYYMLSKVLQAEGNRVPALLCFLRFLTLEIGTERAKEAATAVVNLVYYGVAQEGQKEVSIGLNPGGPADEGDFTAAEFFLSMSAAAGFTEEERYKTPADRLATAITSFIAILDESKDDDLRRTFVWGNAIEPLLEMRNEGHLDSYLALLASTAGVEGVELLPGANEKSVNALVEWLKDSQRSPIAAQ